MARKKKRKQVVFKEKKQFTPAYTVFNTRKDFNLSRL